MRPLIFVFAIFSLVLFAQEPGGGGGKKKGGPPKNLKVLTPEDMAAGAMRNAAQGLGVMCTYCHVDDRSSDEKPEKLVARNMFQLVKDINAKFPDGKVHVTCYTCHRGAQHPEITPSLLEQNGAPPPEDPDRVEVLPKASDSASAAGQILDPREGNESQPVPHTAIPVDDRRGGRTNFSRLEPGLAFGVPLAGKPAGS